MNQSYMPFRRLLTLLLIVLFSITTTYGQGFLAIDSLLRQSEFRKCINLIESVDTKALSKDERIQLNYQKSYAYGKLFEFKQARKLVNDNLDLAKKISSHEHIFESYCLLLEHIFNEERYEDLEVTISQIREMQTSIRQNTTLHGYFKIILGRYYVHKNEKEKAISLFQEAVNTLINLNDKRFHEERLLLDAYWHSGNEYLNIRQTDAALEYYNTAIEYGKITSNQEVFYSAMYKYVLGSRAFHQNNMNEALDYYKESIILYEKLPCKEYLRLGAAQRACGIVYNRKGRFVKAITFLNKGLKNVTQVLDEHSAKVNKYYNTLGGIYAFNNKPDLAIRMLKKVAKNESKAVGKNSEILVYIYHSIASAYHGKRQFDDAIQFAKEAKRILVENKNNNTGFHYSIDNLWASCLTEKGELLTALEMHEANKKLLNGLENNMSFMINTIMNIAVTYRKMGRHKESLFHVQSALKLLDENYEVEDVYRLPNISVGNHLPNQIIQTMSEKIGLLLDQYKKTKNDDELIIINKHLNELSRLLDEIFAIDLYDENTKLLPSNIKVYVNENISEACFSLYEATHDERYIIIALENLEKLRSLQLHEDIFTSTLQVFPKNLRAELQLLRGKVQSLESNLSNAKNTHKISEELDAARFSYDSLRKEMNQSYPQTSLFNRININLKKVREALPSNEAILEYCYGDSSVYLVYMSTSEIDLYKIPLYEPIIQISDKNYSLKDALEYYISLQKLSRLDLEQEQQFLRLGSLLYSKLIPHKIGTSINQLIIVRDGLLNHVPFGGFIYEYSQENIINAKYLFKKLSIVYEPSIRFFANIKEQSAFPKVSTLSVAPTFEGYDFTHSDVRRLIIRGEFDTLIGNREEAKLVHEILGGELLLGKEATKESFLQKLSDHNVLHLATHAFIDSLSPLHSKLLFTKEKTVKDELSHTLNNAEIYSLPLEKDLVMLSACSTADGAFEEGEGVMSLGRGFLSTGTKSIMASLWAVSDDEAPKIVSSFCQYLTKGYTKGEALRKAKIEFLESANDNNKYPFYWNSFILIGDDSAFFEKQGFSYKWWIVLASVLIGLFIFLKNRKRLLI